jgi:hypothetical protein
MSISGIVRGNRIELDDVIPLPDGTCVTIHVSPELLPHAGSPAAVLSIVGTLSEAEAKAIEDAPLRFRRIQPELWSDYT